MIVVADAGPIHCLVLIEFVDVLSPLYDRVLIPQTVAEELKRGRAAEIVRAWLEHPPEWCQLQPDPVSDPTLDETLDPVNGRRSPWRFRLPQTASCLMIGKGVLKQNAGA